MTQAPVSTKTPAGPPPLVIAVSELVPDAVLKIAQPGDLATSEGAVWISDLATDSLLAVDPATSKVKNTVAAGKKLCRGLAADFGAVLLAHCPSGELIRFDPKANAVVEPIPTSLAARAGSIATGVGSIWAITDENGTIARIDPVARVTVAEIYTSTGATSIAFGEDGLWVASPKSKLVTRINPYTNVIVETIVVPSGPAVLAVGEGAIWTFNESDGSLTRIDPKTNAVVTTIPLVPGGGADGRIVAGLGSVWVSTSQTPLTRIDPRTNRVVQVFTGEQSGLLAMAADSLWMAGGPGLVWRLDPRRIEATRPALAAQTQP